MRQILIFPDPRPLVERLGGEFFRNAPEAPGVYLMRDASDAVLYVGKARNLRKRLNAYRVANPDRMARRHLRMLRAVSRIELQLCPDEAAALARESELLLALKPRFNRAGTWRGPSRFLLWRGAGERLELAVTEAGDSDWRVFGPLGSSVWVLRGVLARLLWCAVHPAQGFCGMPAGWAHGQFDNPTTIRTEAQNALAALAVLEQLFSGDAASFCQWYRARIPAQAHPFEATAAEADLEWLGRDFYSRLWKKRS